MTHGDEKERLAAIARGDEARKRNNAQTHMARRRDNWLKSRKSIPIGKRDAWLKLHQLLAERDEGFVDDTARERNRLRIHKLLARLRGDDPRWSTVGRSDHIPEHKQEEYRIRCAVLDIKRLLGIK